MSVTAKLVALVAIAVCAGLTACSAVEQSQETTGATESSQPSTPVAPVDPSPEQSGDAMSETPIRIVVGDETLEARLWDNPAARSLVDQLPLTLDFSDYGRQEVIGAPPRPLTMDGMPAGESAPAGTIGWYEPSGVIVLYYTDVGVYNGIVRIGRLDGDVSILTGWSGARPVTIELAD